MAEYQKIEYRIGKDGKIIETVINASGSSCTNTTGRSLFSRAVARLLRTGRRTDNTRRAFPQSDVEICNLIHVFSANVPESTA